MAERALPGLRRGFFLDIGAHDGVRYSNTYGLEQHLGWRGVCIDGDPAIEGVLRSNRPLARVFSRVVAGTSGARYFASRGMGSAFTAASEGGIEVAAIGIEALLSTLGVPRIIDYLSIDVEGAEGEILAAFPFDTHAFRCATIEMHHNAAGYAETVALLARYGYEIVARFFSDWFVVNRVLLPEYAGVQGDDGAWFTEFLARRLDSRLWSKPELDGVPWVEAWRAAGGPRTPAISCRNDDPCWFLRYPHPALANAVAQEGPSVAFRSLGWPTWGLLYHLVLAACRPDEHNNLVEIGTDTGLSTVVLAQMLMDWRLTGRVYTYEADDARRAGAAVRVEAAGLGDRIELRGAFDGVPPGAIRAAFIDFSKGGAENIAALHACWKVLVPGGLIVFDNAWSPGVRAAVDVARYELAADVLDLPHASWGFWPPAPRGGAPGWAVVQKMMGDFADVVPDGGAPGMGR